MKLIKMQLSSLEKVLMSCPELDKTLKHLVWLPAMLSTHLSPDCISYISQNSIETPINTLDGAYLCTHIFLLRCNVISLFAEHYILPTIRAS